MISERCRFRCTLTGEKSFAYCWTADIVTCYIDRCELWGFIIYLVLNKGICIYNTEITLRLYLSAVTDIDIITPLS